MRINRVSEELIAPEWVDSDKMEKSVTPPENELLEVDLVRVASMKKEMGTNDIVEEKEHIEKCAESNSFYHYNKNWTEDVVSELREYASACGMDLSKFLSIEPDNYKDIEKNASVKIMRVASKVNDSGIDFQALKEAIADPFKIDVAGDMSHMEKTNWEGVKKADALIETERVAPIKGNIVAVRGGESTDVAFNPKSGNSKNTISNPKAIEEYISAGTEDNGARLQKEKAQKEAQKKQNHKDWQNEKIASMEKSDILPKGKVFVTESMNAQPGIKTPTTQMGIYSDFDPKNLPDKTAGEQLAEKNVTSRKSIQREEKNTKEWEVMNKASYRSLSEDFGSELDGLLGKGKTKGA